MVFSTDLCLAQSATERLGVGAVLLPVFSLLVLGAIFRRVGFPGDSFWVPVERLTYFVLFPALIATTLASADLGATPWPQMAAAIIGAMALVTAGLFVLWPLMAVDGPRFTSLCQGAIRMNTYVGLSVAAGLGGDAGLAHAAVAIAIIVPLVNLTCVTTLARYGEGVDGRDRPSVFRSLVTNPLIIASAIGIGLNVAGLEALPVMTPAAEALGRAALPLGLLAVGAAIRWGSLATIGVPEITISAVKLAVLPSICAALLWWIGVEGVAAAVAVLFTALPTAPSSYLLARQMGGDAVVMASLVTLQTLAALVTLPVALALGTP